MKQKNYFNDTRRSRWLPTLVMLLAMFAGGVSPAWADEITVYSDADYSSDYVPFDGYDADAAQHDQLIFPSTQLTSLIGQKITSMTFYYKTNESSGTNIGNWDVSLATTTETTLSALDTTTPLTQVFSGAITPDTESKTITITFSDDYVYNGGNLLVDFNHPVASGYKKFTFWCSYISPAPAYSKGATRTYLPKTTFTYETATVSGPSLVVKDGTNKITTGHDYSFGLSIAGTTHTFTLSNPGTAAVEGLAVTDKFGATLSATTIAAGGEVTLTITMPDASASEAITISSTTTGIDDFVINVSGTVRDPNKVYLDFADGTIPDGWTSVQTGSYGSAWAASTGYISQSGSYSGYAWAFTSPKLNFTNGEKVFFETAKYSSGYSSPSITVEYTTDATGATGWTAIGPAFTNDTYGNWTSRSVTIPVEGVKRIRFNGWYVHMRNIYGGEEPNEPNMVVTQPTTLGFGLYDKDASPAPTKTFTIANTGKAVLNGISVTSGNAAFTITGAPASLAAGEDAEVTITMSTATAGALSSLITVSATDMEDASFTVTGTVKPAGMSVEEFTDGLPANWTNASWTFANGEATGKSSSAYLTTPKISFSAGDFIIIKAKRFDNDATDYLTVQGSNDNGSTWTAYSKKLQNADGLTYPDCGTMVLTDIPTSVNKLRFVGYYCVVDEIHGLNYAPVLSVTTGTPAAAVTTPANYDFGECVADADVTYNFANSGAGTINITNVTVTGEGAAAYTTNWSESVYAPFALKITRSYDGNRAAAAVAVVTVTTSEGDFVINVTGSDKAGNAPEIAVDATALDFGKLTANDAKTVTVTNSGTGSMDVTIDSDNELFALSTTSLTGIGAGESKTFDVTFRYSDVAGSYGTKTANITVTPSYDAEAVKTITATAKAKDPEEWSEDFAGNVLPDGWETVGSGWTITDGIARGSYTSGSYLYTPTLTVAAGQSLTFKAKARNYNTDIKVEYSKDGGDYTSVISENRNNQSDYETYTIDNLETANYKFRFSADNFDLDEIEGLKLCANDPKPAVYSDEACKTEVATGTALDFGFVTADASATYYIKNVGTGTMTISDITVPDGITAAIKNNATTVAAGDNKLELTVSMAASGNVGYHHGTVTVTTDGGTFEIPVAGIVRDASKLFIDFSAENAAIPTNWTANNWTISSTEKAAYSGSTSNSMITTKLTIEEGEKLVILAKRNYGNTGDNKISVFSSADGKTWSETPDYKVAYNDMSTDKWNYYEVSNITAGKRYIAFAGDEIYIQKIYGFLEEPYAKMVSDVANYDFGKKWEEATTTFTVTNNGTANLTGIAVTIDDETNFTVAVDKNTVTTTEGDKATITVTMKGGIEAGAHSATVTLKADDQEDLTFTVSGTATYTPDPAVAVKEGSTLTTGSTQAFGEIRTDATKTYTITNNGGGTLKAAITADGDVNAAPATLSVAAGESADFTVTLPLGADNFGAKTGSVSIAFTDGTDATVGNFTLTFTGTTIDPTIIDFADKKIPAGWFAGGNWTVNNSEQLQKSKAAETDVVTAAFNVTDATKTLTYQAGKYDTGTATLSVYTSTDRMTWTEVAETERPNVSTSTMANYTITAPAAGTVYVKFTASNVVIDNISGWAAAAVPEHDIYVATYNVPTASVTPGSSITATATVANLVAESESVTATLYVNDAAVEGATATQSIAKGTSYQFSLTGAVPATEGEYSAYIMVTGENVADQQADAQEELPVAHVRKVNVSSFTAEAATAQADAANTFTATFNVTVARDASSTTDIAAGYSVQVIDADENVVGTGVTTKALTADDATEVLTITTHAIAAGTGGDFTFRVKNGESIYTTSQTITVTATAPVLALYDGDTQVTSTTNYELGYVTTAADAVVKTIKIKNSGVVALSGLTVESSSANFTVNKGEATGVAANDGENDGEAEFTVALADEAAAGKLDATITVNGANAETPLTFTVSAYKVDDTKMYETFAAEPADWTNDGWTFEEGHAVAASADVTMTSPVITVADGDVMAVRATANGSLPELKYCTSADGGNTWSSASSNQAGAVSNGNYTTIYISGLATTVNRIKLQGYQIKLDAVNGFAINDNAPMLAVAPADAAAFGTVKAQPEAKTYTITNVGTGTLTGTIASDNATFTVSKSDFSLGKGESTTFDVALVFDTNYGEKSANITIASNGGDDKVIAATATTKDPNVWEEDFEEGTPEFWLNSGSWAVTTPTATGNNGTKMMTISSYDNPKTLTTPRLEATAGQQLTFYIGMQYDDEPLIIEYQKEGTDEWNVIETGVANYKASGNITFTAPADGYYNIRFTGTYAMLDNFSGFKLAVPDHIMAITASNIPATGLKQGVAFNATVTVAESRGVAEEFTATVYMGTTAIGSAEGSVDANGTKQLTIACTPVEAAETAEMHIEVVYGGGTLKTETVTRSVAAPVVLALSEDSSEEITTGTTYDVITLTRSFVAGWNTFVAPLSVNLSEFGEGVKAYTLSAYENGVLKFTSVSGSTLNPATPYVVFVEEAMTDKKFTWENTSVSSMYVGDDNIKVSYSDMTFQGTYAPIDDMSGKWGIGTAKDGKAKIMKGGTNAKMKGFRAYFALPGNTQGAPTMMFDEEVITGISAIEMAAEEGERIYNLNGQRVMNPKKGQMYIVNGKKVAIK